ncbi:MAG: phosphotransferase enzyme family protein [Actinopolymorphaceae bacterium]
MMLGDLSGFLPRYGIDAATAVVAPLTRGEKNATWSVTLPTGRRLVVRQYAASDADEVEYELAASEFLARQGFPTPAPVRTSAGELWIRLAGHPAAVFTFADGVHPPERDGGYGSFDLDLGRQAAALAAHLHVVSGGRSFPGRRSAHRDPLHQVGAFLSGPYVRLPVMQEVVDQLAPLHARIARVYDRPDGLRKGLVHLDITAANLLVDKESGAITTLLDFDDCAESFQLYDLGSIVDTWGRDAHRHADLERIGRLIEAYDEIGALSKREIDLTADFLALCAAATGVGVLSRALRAGGTVRDARESYSMLLFLDLRVAARDGWRFTPRRRSVPRPTGG